MTTVSLDLLCSEPAVRWHIQRYVPLLQEFETDQLHARALAHSNDLEYRVSKLVQDASSRSGHYIVASAFKLIAQLQNSAQVACPLCGQAVRRGGVLVGMQVFHKRCVPGFINPGIADDLVLFGEELQDLRLMPKVPPRPSTT